MNLRMHFATGMYRPDTLKRYKVRMSTALLLSLLLHAYLLSLQFGIRGLGLPGLQMPWEERRAQTPGIAVNIADARRKDSPDVASAPAHQPGNAVKPAPDMPVSPPPQARAEPAPAAPPRPAPKLKTVRRAETPADAAHSKTRKPAPAKQRRKTQPQHVRRAVPQVKPRPHVKPSPPVIAKKSMRQDTFVLPHPDETIEQQPAVDKNAVETPVAATPPVEATPMQQQEQAEAARKLREQEDARRAEEIAAKRLEEVRRLMASEAQRQAEEEARRTAQRRAKEEQARQADQLLAQRLAEENARRQAAELEARRQAEEAARRIAEEEQQLRARQQQAKMLEEENARRQAMEEEARRRAMEEQLAAENARRVRLEEAQRQEAVRAQRLVEEEQQLRARQQQAKMLEEENARRQAMEEEARRRVMEEQLAAENARRIRLEEAQRQEAAQAQRLAEEQQAQQRAAEAARQQEAALAEQQRHGASGSQGQSQGNSSGQSGDGLAGRQTEQAQVPVARPAQVPIEERSSKADDGAIELSDEQMASMGAVQVRKVEHEPVNTAQDSRRRTIFGGAEDDIVLKMYIADWLQAVERNGKQDDAASSNDKPYGNSLVTVALRSDGRVENITIHRSNGRAGLDKVVQRIIQAEERYKAFPPDLIRRYDVIEIRRVWKFGDGLHIIEEGH